MKKLFAFFLFFSLSLASFSQTDNNYWEWAKSYGAGTVTDIKSNNGYLYVCGNFADTQLHWDRTLLVNNGGADIFIAKLDTNGNTIWVKNFGGNADETIDQMELNSRGGILLKCKSGSQDISFGNYQLRNAINFYTTVDFDGNVLSASKLSDSLYFTDAAIDYNGDVYFCGVDGANSGAVLVKYNRDGSQGWRKIVQAENSDATQIFVYDGYSPGGQWETIPPSYDAYVSMTIEHNESDSTIAVSCDFNRKVSFENATYVTPGKESYPYYYSDYRIPYHGCLRFRCSVDGSVSNVNHTTNFIKGIFETGKSGYTYTTWYANTFLSQTENWGLLKSKPNSLIGMSWGSNTTSQYIYTTPAINVEMPVILSESGELAMSYYTGNDYRRDNIIIFDSLLHTLKVTDFDDYNYKQHVLFAAKCMVNSSAIYFANEFPADTLNKHIPGFEIELPQRGIVVAKYSLKSCLPSKRIDKRSICSGSNYTFPDGTVQNNIIVGTSHESRFIGAAGCDSIIVTNILINPVYNYSETVKVCYGSSYNFPDNITISDITDNVQHTSLMTTVNGCDSIIVTNLHVITIDSGVTRSNLELRSNNNAAAYQWIDCASGLNIAGASDQTFTVSSVGSYAVAVSSEGCTDTSSCYIITAADLVAGGQTLVRVYPVPAGEQFTLVMQCDQPSAASLSLVDFSGQAVSNENIQLYFGKNVITKNIAALAPGTYTLVIKKVGDSRPITKRIVKL